MDSEDEYTVVSDTASEYRDANALDPELSAIYDNMLSAAASQTGEPIQLVKTLRRYGIAIVQVDSTIKSTIVDVVNSCQDEAVAVFSASSEKQSFAMYMSASAFANDNYMTNVLLVTPPCERTWARILTGWPLNLRIALIADELNAPIFERRILA